MYLPKLSEEQQKVVDYTNKGYNIIVDAVAGSGKTTTILHIAHANPSKKVMLLTYNARLKDETRERVLLNNIENLEAHSYHAFCVKYYSRMAHTDIGIQYILDNNTKPIQDIIFDILIIDEAQDMTPLLYNIASKIIQDNINFDINNKVSSDFDSFSDAEDCDLDGLYNYMTDESSVVLNSVFDPSGSYQICIFGDVMQNIYGFKYSDGRYLSMADEIFKSQGDWIRLSMSYSFRITSPMANFLNKVVLKSSRMYSKKPGEKVDYLICNPFNKSIFEYLIKLLITYAPSDVFVIAPSIKNNGKHSPISILENNLVSAGYPCFVPINEDIILKPTDITGKIVFTTIHQSKGLERKIVIMFGFDESYFTYFDRKGDQTICPNGIYVGITRALERLCVIHSYNQNYLKFLNTSSIPDICNVIYKARFCPKNADIDDKRNFTVTELTKYLDANFINSLIKEIDINKKVSIPIRKQINVPLPIGFISRYEGEIVSDINGLCIPMIYEYQATKTSSIFKYVFDNDSHIENIPKAHRAIINQLRDKYISNTELSLSEYLYITNVYIAVTEGYHFKISQIKNYNWLEIPQIRSAIQLLQKYINAKRAVFENPVVIKLENSVINGRIDIISTNPNVEIIWEIKCVDILTDVHILQLACYAYIYERMCISNRKTRPRRYILLSIKTDNMIEIIVDIVKLEMIMKKLIAEKTRNVKLISDIEFVNKHTK